MRAISGTNKDGNGTAIAAWYMNKTCRDFEGTYSALAFLDEDNDITTAAIFFDFNGYNIEIAYFGKLTRQRIQFIAKYAFGQLKCGRVTIKVSRRDWSVVSYPNLEKIGFRQEAILSHYFGPEYDDDAIIYRVLLDDLVPKWVYNNVRSSTTI